jgi:putative FmdB family regulatory protein
MPTYEYVCTACSHEFDEFQSITAKPLRKCPDCGKNTLKRKIGTGAGVIFRGSGFYETDYRSESYTKAAKAEKDAAAPKSDTKSADKAGDKSSAAKSEATPAKKSEPAASKPAKSAKSDK